MSFKNKLELTLKFLKKNNFDEQLLSMPKLVYFRNINTSKKKNIFKKIIYELKNLKIINVEGNFYNTYYDTLLVSHLTKNINDKGFKDEYMGILDNQLKKNDNVIKIFINHTEKKFTNLYPQSYNNRYPYLILSKRFNIFFELYIFFIFFFKFFYFKVIFFFSKNSILNISLKDYLSGISNYRIYLKILKIIIKINPKKVYIPFEGHPWEKLIFLKTKNLNIRRYGYQFNISDKNNYLFYYLRYSEISPEKLFLTGEYIKKIAKIFNNSIEYKVIGSERLYKVTQKKTIYNSILVIPEGREEEELIFINFLNQYIDKYDNFLIYLKLHPLCINRYPINKKINVYNGNIDNLINKCNFALYRGSNLIFNMVNNNLIPLYLNFSKENISVLDKNFFSLNINNFNDLNNIKDLKKKYLDNIKHKNLQTLDRYFKKQ